MKVHLRLPARNESGPNTRQIGGYTIMILGEAKPADWQGWQPGDLEGMVWTTPRQVAQVMRNLAGQPGVIATFGEPEP